MSLGPCEMTGFPLIYSGQDFSSTSVALGVMWEPSTGKLTFKFYTAVIDFAAFLAVFAYSRRLNKSHVQPQTGFLTPTWDDELLCRPAAEQNPVFRTMRGVLYVCCLRKPVGPGKNSTFIQRWFCASADA